MNNQVVCTDGNILVKEFRKEESESGIFLGEGNSEMYSMYEIISVNKNTKSELEELIGKGEKLDNYLLLYSSISRVPITKTKFIVHIKDCFGLVKKDDYEKVISE